MARTQVLTNRRRTYTYSVIVEPVVWNFFRRPFAVLANQNLRVVPVNLQRTCRSKQVLHSFMTMGTRRTHRTIWTSEDNNNGSPETVFLRTSSWYNTRADTCVKVLHYCFSFFPLYQTPVPKSHKEK
jgi:hypothetical protein